MTKRQIQDETLKFLITECGLDLNQREPKLGSRFTALELCYYDNKLALGRLLLEHGFDPNLKNGHSNPLLILIFWANPSGRGGTLAFDRKPWFDLLMEFGADINIVSEVGCNAIYYALEDESRYFMIEWLLDAGIKVLPTNMQSAKYKKAGLGERLFAKMEQIYNQQQRGQNA